MIRSLSNFTLFDFQFSEVKFRFVPSFSNFRPKIVRTPQYQNMFKKYLNTYIAYTGIIVCVCVRGGGVKRQKITHKAKSKTEEYNK